MSYDKYIVSMFPYPSGSALHAGHSYGYIGADVYSRYMKSIGLSVLQPLGFDSFGLPTETYAEKLNKTPQEVTETNISNFKEQLYKLDLDIDWDSEIVTSDPNYYKWTQWIFTELYNSWYNEKTDKAEDVSTCPHENKDDYRLAYKGINEVNWCENLNTVLSNDETITVGNDVLSERGNHPVIKKSMEQWFLRITPYKNRLKNDLDKIEWKNKKVQYNWIEKTHDIVFSRQRTWGEPIPIYKKDGVYKTLDLIDLPLTFDKKKSFVDNGGETDIMPSIAGSNWYFYRYLDPLNDKCFCDINKQQQVDVYIGGNEHTTGHVLYARFITKFLFDKGHSTFDEPFKKIVNVGIVLGEDGLKMSKSKGNSINPIELVEQYGIDAFRLHVSFIAPFEIEKKWQSDSIKGCRKMLNKIESCIDKIVDIYNEKQMVAVDKLKVDIGRDIEKFSFNTCIPKYMTFINNISKEESISKEVYNKFLNILSPFCPTFTNYIIEKIK